MVSNTKRRHSICLHADTYFKCKIKTHVKRYGNLGVFENDFYYHDIIKTPLRYDSDLGIKSSDPVTYPKTISHQNLTNDRDNDHAD